MEKKELLLKTLSDCVLEMDDEEVIDAVKKYVAEGYDPQEGMLQGLADGMERASVLYEEGEYFVPELIMCSEVMYAGMGEFQKHLPETMENSVKNSCGKVAIGVVEGDTHDIGKNLVKIMLETGGFIVDDMGRDVPVETFVNYVKENDVDILCMSSLMTTTMPSMENVIKRLEEEGVRNKVKIMVGGAPVSPLYAKKIGADAYSRNAIEAVVVAKTLL